MEVTKPSSGSICPSSHQGTQIICEEFAMNIDQLFTQIFTSNQFMHDFHKTRQTTDLSSSEWKYMADSKLRTRTVTFTMALNQTLGPKSSMVHELQTILPCSVPGELYAIDADTCNKGIPYADNFHILAHFCMKRVSNNQTLLEVYGEIKYKKSTWGVVKNLIEKNTIQGMFDFYRSMASELHASSGKRKISRNRTNNRMHRYTEKTPKTGSQNINLKSARPNLLYIVLLLLIVLNVYLLYYLRSMESSLEDLNSDRRDIQMENLQQHGSETDKLHPNLWEDDVKSSIALLNKLENSLLHLREKLFPEQYAN